MSLKCGLSESKLSEFSRNAVGNQSYFVRFHFALVSHSVRNGFAFDSHPHRILRARIGRDERDLGDFGTGTGGGKLAGREGKFAAIWREVGLFGERSSKYRGL